MTAPNPLNSSSGSYNPFRTQIAQAGLNKPDAYNPYAAGAKIYGMARRAPTIGPVDTGGYAERDQRAAAVRNARLQRMQAGQSGQYASQSYLGGQ